MVVAHPNPVDLNETEETGAGGLSGLLSSGIVSLGGSDSLGRRRDP